MRFSRLASVSDGNGNSATYSYLANSPLVGQIVFASNMTTRMTTTNQYDYLNRLTSISSTGGASGAVPVSFNYAYNSANQRTRSTLVDNSYWAYAYDALGQVTSGHKHWSDNTVAAGQQFDYAFDTIGNRQTTGRAETPAEPTCARPITRTIPQPNHQPRRARVCGRDGR